MNWASFLARNTGRILHDFGSHVWLSLLPLAVGFLIALPIGYWARRFAPIRAPLLAVSGVLYAIPSLALFVILPGIIGTKILSPLNVAIALTIYTIALLVRSVADGLSAVPDDVSLAATAFGYKRLRRLLRVELPIAVPVIFSGLRVASVSNISLVSVGALIGVRSLGELFTHGYQRHYFVPIVLGIVGSILLAVLADVLLVGLQRLLTPWRRARA
jgi:osmoprotectant transport system permease protein